MTAAAERLLQRLLRARWTGESVDDAALGVDAAAFADQVQMHGLAGVLLRRHAEQVQQLPSELVAVLRGLQQQSTTQALRQAGSAITLIAALEAGGVPVLAMKGLVVSWRLYGDIGVRSSRDIDLLVDPVDLNTAITLLLAAGCRPAEPLPPTPAHWAAQLRTFNHVSFVDARGSYVELHWRSDPLHGTALPALRTLLPELGRIPDGPLRGLRCLSPERLEYSLASHAGRSRCYRWKWGYDLLEIVSARQPGNIPWTASDAAGLAPLTRHVVLATSHQWDVLDPPPWPIAITGRAAVIERQLLRNERSHTFGIGCLLHLAVLVSLDRWPVRLEYLAMIATRVPANPDDPWLQIAVRRPWLGPVVKLMSLFRRLARGR